MNFKIPLPSELAIKPEDCQYEFRYKVEHGLVLGEKTVLESQVKMISLERANALLAERFEAWVSKIDVKRFVESEHKKGDWSK